MPPIHGAISSIVIGWVLFAEIAANTPEWIAVILTIIGSTGVAVWRLSARLQKGDDTMKVLNETLKRQNARLDTQRGIIEDHGKVLMNTTDSLHRIEKRLWTLPCKADKECPKE